MGASVTEIVREFVGLPSPAVGRAGAGGHPCQGIYYRPAGSLPASALIATHYNVDFSEHYLARLMAERGFGFLGWNTSFRGAERTSCWITRSRRSAWACAGYASRPAPSAIVLLGNSGGGSLMAAYQSQAVEPCVVPVAGMRPLAASMSCRRLTCTSRSRRTRAVPRF